MSSSWHLDEHTHAGIRSGQVTKPFWSGYCATGGEANERLSMARFSAAGRDNSLKTHDSIFAGLSFNNAKLHLLGRRVTCTACCTFLPRRSPFYTKRDTVKVAVFVWSPANNSFSRPCGKLFGSPSVKKTSSPWSLGAQLQVPVT